MGLTNELVGSKKPVKINAFMLTRAELLITLCYEIPCTRKSETLTVELMSLEKVRPFIFLNRVDLFL